MAATPDRPVLAAALLLLVASHALAASAQNQLPPRNAPAGPLASAKPEPVPVSGAFYLNGDDIDGTGYAAVELTSRVDFQGRRYGWMYEITTSRTTALKTEFDCAGRVRLLREVSLDASGAVISDRPVRAGAVSTRAGTFGAAAADAMCGGDVTDYERYDSLELLRFVVLD